jgi:hypothetical protein
MMKEFTSVLFVLFLNTWLCADVSHGVLEKHPNSIFVTTGIGACISIARAFNANFAEVYGIEEDPSLVEHSHHVIPIYFKDNWLRMTNIIQVLQGGADRLSEVINNIHQPITFLLSSYRPDLDNFEQANVILEELEQIKNHPIKTHTILIENIHLAGSPLFGNIKLNAITNKLLEIYPHYKFSYETGGHLEKEERAILVAYP